MGDWFGGGLVRVEMARDLSSSAQIASAGVGAGAVVSAVGLESLNAWVQVEPSPADCLPHQDDLRMIASLIMLIASLIMLIASLIRLIALCAGGAVPSRVGAAASCRAQR